LAGAAGEFDRIERYLRPLAHQAESLALTDDAAVIVPPAGKAFAITKDALVAGVHFLPEDPPDLIARKLLRVNYSDLAAMGAEPYGYFTALSLPKDLEESWFARFAEGLAEDQGLFGGSLLGGDLTSTPGPLTLSLTAFGLLPLEDGTPQKGRCLRRNGAHAGEDVYVTGCLGDAALGLLVAKGHLHPETLAEKQYLQGRYHLPQPRLEVGQALLGLASAALDISDGLMGDLQHLAKASQVRVKLSAPCLPLSPAVAAVLATDPSALTYALQGGDDYELVFTAPRAARDQIARLSQTFANQQQNALADFMPPPPHITRIGETLACKGVTDSKPLVWVEDRDGALVSVGPKLGFQHF